jgi:hypothetical protein
VYNKLFSKILDSSIWLASDATRLVFLTCIASMDEDGICHFASVPNLAHRARVDLAAAERAVAELEAPDPHSADPENGGRRLERVPGGWLVLNAAKYRELVKRSDQRAATARRVRKHRETRRNTDSVTGNRSDTDTYTEVHDSGAADAVLAVPQPDVAPAAPTATETGSGGDRRRKLEDGGAPDPAEAPIVAPEAAGVPRRRITDRSPGLIRGPLEYAQALERCAYVGARLEVPHKLHRDLSRESGGLAGGLLAWYADVDRELEASGEVIKPNVFRWLTEKWRIWVGGPAATPAERLRIKSLPVDFTDPALDGPRAIREARERDEAAYRRRNGGGEGGNGEGGQ